MSTFSLEVCESLNVSLGGFPNLCSLMGSRKVKILWISWLLLVLLWRGDAISSFPFPAGKAGGSIPTIAGEPFHFYSMFQPGKGQGQSLREEQRLKGACPSKVFSQKPVPEHCTCILPCIVTWPPRWKGKWSFLKEPVGPKYPWNSAKKGKKGRKRRRR